MPLATGPSGATSHPFFLSVVQAPLLPAALPLTGLLPELLAFLQPILQLNFKGFLIVSGACITFPRPDQEFVEFRSHILCFYSVYQGP